MIMLQVKISMQLLSFVSCGHMTQGTHWQKLTLSCSPLHKLVRCDIWHQMPEQFVSTFNLHSSLAACLPTQYTYTHKYPATANTHTYSPPPPSLYTHSCRHTHQAHTLKCTMHACTCTHTLSQVDLQDRKSWDKATSTLFSSCLWGT